MSLLTSGTNIKNKKAIVDKYPRKGILLCKLLENFDQNSSAFTAAMRDMIIAYTAGLNNRTVNDTPTAVVDEKQIPEKLKPVLQLVKKLTLHPGQISQRDVQSMFSAGWDETAYLDAVFLCSLTNTINRFEKGIGVL